MEIILTAITFAFTLSSTAAIKCYVPRSNVANSTGGSHYIYCATDCCGLLCCPAGEYYDTSLTESLATIFVGLFFFGLLCFILSWMNLKNIIRTARDRAFQRHSMTLNSVEASLHPLPRYDVPELCEPHFYQDQRMNMHQNPSHLLWNKKTKKSSDSNPPLEQPPSYSMITQIQTDRQTQ